MQNVPHEFVSRVLTKLETPEINKIGHIAASVWNEAARTHQRKLQHHYCELQLAEGDQAYQFTSYQHIPHDLWGYSKRTLTLEELRKLDDRFVRVTGFVVNNRPALERDGSKSHVSVKRMPHILKFLSRFQIPRIEIAVLVNEQLGRELVNHDLKTRFLILQPSVELAEFLKRQLKNEELTELQLVNGTWLPELKEDIVSFVCRPKFRYLETSHHVFYAEDFKQIVDYWKSMNSPWENATISMHVGQNWKNEFASWMLPIATKNLGQEKFREEIGGFELVVTCTDERCKLVFSRFETNSFIGA